MRVLLIEDDYAVSQSVETILKKEGMVVDTTDDGEDGLDCGKLYDYDIIILDLNLPGMNGYEVLKSLRNAKINTPVLILSGLYEPDKKVKGLGYGADDYLTKPFDKNELFNAFNFLKINKYGLTREDIEIIKIMKEKFIRPTSLEAIAALINDDVNNIKNINEPFLVSKGIIERTKQGRKLTKFGEIIYQEFYKK